MPRTLQEADACLNRWGEIAYEGVARLPGRCIIGYRFRNRRMFSTSIRGGEIVHTDEMLDSLQEFCAYLYQNGISLDYSTAVKETEDPALPDAPSTGTGILCRVRPRVEFEIAEATQTYTIRIRWYEIPADT